MNSEVSNTVEEKKDMLSTPKFHINKSIYSIERDQNTLDTLKQNINNLINEDKSCNEEKINENKNEQSIKEFVLSSSFSDKKNNINELNNCFINQFSFDETSQNFIFSKNESDVDNNKENIDNNVILINENGYNHDDNSDNNEIKYINNIDNIDTFLIESNKKNSNENSDVNFNYILPLESDKSSEQFNLISFQGYSEETVDNKNIQLNKIPNQKKIVGEQKNFNNPEIINKKIGIGYLLKIKNNKDVINEKRNLTPQKKDKLNKLSLNCQNISINRSKSNNNIKKINSNYDLLTKKKTFHLKIPSLIEEYKHNRCLTEPNDICLKYKTLNNSQKNTFFTSNDNAENKNHTKNEKNNKLTPVKENNIINPFIIGNINSDNDNDNNNVNDNKMTKKDKRNNNNIQEMTIFKKVGLKNRHSVNYVKRNNKFINDNRENNEINIIYEKNLKGKENNSFSINKNKKHKLIHSRNSSHLSQSSNTYDHTSINQNIKNCIFLLSQRNMKSSPIQTRQNSSKNYSISASDSSTQKAIKKIKEGKCSPFYKYKIRDILINKKHLLKKFIFTQSSSSSVQNKKSIIQIKKSIEKFEDENNSISSNKLGTNKFTVFSNYDSKKNKKELEKPSKDKIKIIEIKKIKVNTINNNNRTKNDKSHLNNSCYMNYKKNTIKNEMENKIDNLTERNKEILIGPANIYSKKFVLSTNNNYNNYITNIYTTNDNDSNNCLKIKKTNNNNKSTIINREKKKLSTTENNSKNNSKNNSINAKEKINFHKYFNHLLSKIDLHKKTINKTISCISSISNTKKKNKTRNHNNLSNIFNNTHTHTQQ